MPACFQLIPKGASEPAKLALVDDAICAHFGVEPDPIKYYHGWYDAIGFRLAIGKSFSDIIAELESTVTEAWNRSLTALEPSDREWSAQKYLYYKHLEDIALWLDANYNARSWHGHR